MLGGEPLSEEDYDNYTRFSIETTAVGVEKPVDAVKKAQHSKDAAPPPPTHEGRGKCEAAMRHIIETGDFQSRPAMGNPFRASMPNARRSPIN